MPMQIQRINAIYDQAAGLGDETVHGPYKSEGTLRNFGLKVNEQKTKLFVQRYLLDKAKGSGVEFAFEGDEIVMQVTYFKKRRGQNGTLVWRNVSFCIPMECTFRGTKTQGFLPVFSFSSNMFSVVTLSEINGTYTEAVQMWSPNDLWTENLTRETPKKNVFTLDTNVIPKGAKEYEHRRLIAVRNTKKVANPQSKSTLHQNFIDELEGRKPFWVYSLKQFPKAQFASRACYQGLVRVHHTPDKQVEATTQHQHNARIRIYDYESHPICQNLGLVVKKTSLDKVQDTTFSVLEPTFYTVTTGKFDEALGETMAYRVDNLGEASGWKEPPIRED